MFPKKKEIISTEPSVKELVENMKKMRQKGLQPHLKGNSRGYVKLKFD